MSLALTQRVKDLEKKVEHLERSMVVMQNAMEAKEPLAAQVEVAAERLLDVGINVETFVGDVEKKVAEKTKKLCPKCNKAPGYFFHVRSCKG